VVSGNVSLYNESDGTAIYPTPIVGALGVLDDVEDTVSSGFVADGDVVYLIGAESERRDGDDVLVGEAGALAGSEYLRLVYGLIAGSPRIDLALEARVQRVLVAGASEGLLRSAHDCSHGGLAVALAEACLTNGVGFVSERVSLAGRRDAAQFGEDASRIVVSVAGEQVADLEQLLARVGVPFLRLGMTGGDRLQFGGAIDIAMTELREAHEAGLPRALVADAPSRASG
jgi:phosphoribosylformylglycinamidine (FGAM) synthase-like enzyme